MAASDLSSCVCYPGASSVFREDNYITRRDGLSAARRAVGILEIQDNLVGLDAPLMLKFTMCPATSNAATSALPTP